MRNHRNRTAVLRRLLIAAAGVALATGSIGAGCSETAGQIGSNMGSVGNLMNMGNRGSSAAAAANSGGVLGAVSSLGFIKPGDAQALAGAADLLGNQMTDSEETRLAYGETVALGVASQYGLSSDAKLNKYVTLVGLTLQEKLGSELVFEFGVLDTDDVVACSTPSGHVFVSRGAIARMKDESELAGVIAHEMIHAARNHGAGAIKRAKDTDAFKRIVNSRQQVAAFGALTDAGVEITLQRGYEQGQEFEADRDGSALAASAGYDPNGLTRFLSRLGSGRDGGEKFQWDSTHPPRADRIARLRAANAGKSGATLAPRFEQSTRAGQ
jgi:predicted Zn-dependent protease